MLTTNTSTGGVLCVTQLPCNNSLQRREVAAVRSRASGKLGKESNTDVLLMSSRHSQHVKYVLYFYALGNPLQLA